MCKMPSKLLCLTNYGAHGLSVSMNQPYAMRCDGRTDPEGVHMDEQEQARVRMTYEFTLGNR